MRNFKAQVIDQQVIEYILCIDPVLVTIEGKQEGCKYLWSTIV